MANRIENELKIEQLILNNLKELPDYVSSWYSNLKASRKTMSSCNDFVNKIRNYLKSINTDTKNITIDQLTISSIEKYFISIQTKKDNEGNIVYTSDSYQQGIWCALNNFFKYLYLRKLISENYVESIAKPKNHDLERINEHRIRLTQKDFNKILKAVDSGTGTDRSKSYQSKFKSRDKAIIYLFMTTGMRRTALTEISLEDLNLNEKVLYVIDKGNKRHTYSLNEPLVNLLNQWLKDRYDLFGDNIKGNYLFVSNRGQKMDSSSVYYLVEKYSEEGLGYGISPHKLRAGFCSILYDKTKDVEFVRRAVGHSNIATTQRYIVTDNKERQKASEIMSVLSI